MAMTMATKTQETIAEVRRLDKAATARPWAYHAGDNFISSDRCTMLEWQPRSTMTGMEERNANGNLIAEYRAAAPALADAVERRDEVIHQLMAYIAARHQSTAIEIKVSAEAAAEFARQHASGCGLVLSNGKWRIEE